MEVYFQMRFSYCGRPDGTAPKPRQDITQKALPTPSIQESFELLERVTLPSLRDQTDPGFKLIILTSARIPPEFRDQLNWLCNHYLPGRHSIIYARPMIAGRAFRRHMQGVGGGDEPVVQTQLLEGDAFGHEFVKELKKHAIELFQSSGGLTLGARSAGGTFMSFASGYVAGRYRDKIVGLEHCSTIDVPFALSLVARPSGRFNPSLIHIEDLGAKYPHTTVITKKPHCLRVIEAQSPFDMIPASSTLLSQAKEQFGLLRGPHEVLMQEHDASDSKKTKMTAQAVI